MHYIATPLAAAHTALPRPLLLHASHHHAPCSCMYHITTPLMATCTVLPCPLWLHAPCHYACVGLPSTHTFSFFFFLLTPSCSLVTMLSLLSLPTDVWPSSPSGAYHSTTTDHNDNNRDCNNNITWCDNSDTTHGMATITTQPWSPRTAPMTPCIVQQQCLQHYAWHKTR